MDPTTSEERAPSDLSSLVGWAVQRTRPTATASSLTCEQALRIGVTLTIALLPHWSDPDPRVEAALRGATHALTTRIEPALEAVSARAFDVEDEQSSPVRRRIASAAGHCAAIAAGFVGELSDVLEDAVAVAMERDGVSEVEAVARTWAVVQQALRE
ncbi:MAG: hypothetical protein U0353_18780 [Sandaracinus sp.]